MSKTPNVYFTCPPGRNRDRLWRDPSPERAAELGYDVRLNQHAEKLTPEQWADELAGVEALVTTWGAPRLDETVLAKNDCLQIVGHAAGSVSPIVSEHLYERGVRVVTANALMAQGVAETCLMLTFMGCRQVLRHCQFGAAPPYMAWGPRSDMRFPSDCVIGIWGYGDIASRLVKLLEPFKPKEILVCSNHLPAEKAEALGMRKVEFDEIFRESDVIHTLTGLTAKNKGMVGPEQLASIKDDAVLINCGRAALIQEKALLTELRKNRFTAILEVFETEPLPENDPLTTLPNVINMPHNAGQGRDNHYVEVVLDEFDRFYRGEPLQHEITRERAGTMTDPGQRNKK